jgi:hypothetical protein
MRADRGGGLHNCAPAFLPTQVQTLKESTVHSGDKRGQYAPEFKQQTFCKLHRPAAHASKPSCFPKLAHMQRMVIEAVLPQANQVVGLASTAPSHVSSLNQITLNSMFGTMKLSGRALPSARVKLAQLSGCSDLCPIPEENERVKKSTKSMCISDEAEHMATKAMKQLGQASSGCEDISASTHLQEQEGKAQRLSCNKQSNPALPSLSTTYPPGDDGANFRSKHAGQPRAEVVSDGLHLANQLEDLTSDSNNAISSSCKGAVLHVSASTQDNWPLQCVIDDTDTMPAAASSAFACSHQQCGKGDSECSTTKLGKHLAESAVVQNVHISSLHRESTCSGTSPSCAIVALGNDGKLSNKDYFSVKLVQMKSDFA